MFRERVKDSGLFDEPSLPFDSVRVSMEGGIDCIENDFQHFFPKEIKRDFTPFFTFQMPTLWGRHL